MWRDVANPTKDYGGGRKKGEEEEEELGVVFVVG